MHSNIWNTSYGQLYWFRDEKLLFSFSYVLVNMSWTLKILNKYIIVENDTNNNWSGLKYMICLFPNNGSNHIEKDVESWVGGKGNPKLTLMW